MFHIKVIIIWGWCHFQLPDSIIVILEYLVQVFVWVRASILFKRSNCVTSAQVWKLSNVAGRQIKHRLPLAVHGSLAVFRIVIGDRLSLSSLSNSSSVETSLLDCLLTAAVSGGVLDAAALNTYSIIHLTVSLSGQCALKRSVFDHNFTLFLCCNSSIYIFWALFPDWSLPRVWAFIVVTLSLELWLTIDLDYCIVS